MRHRGVNRDFVLRSKSRLRGRGVLPGEHEQRELSCGLGLKFADGRSGLDQG
jgi:hypothetical protein